jgi:hypothetical protein
MALRKKLFVKGDEMKVIYRPYQDEVDFGAMRALLREIYVLNGYAEGCKVIPRVSKYQVQGWQDHLAEF